MYVRKYVRTCLPCSEMSICAHVHAEELMRHIHCLARIPDAKPSNGGRGRTTLLDNGG